MLQSIANGGFLMTYYFLLSINLFVSQTLTQNAPSYDESIPEPSLSEISYCQYERHAINFWKAESTSPTLLEFLVNGVGWRGGEKERVHCFEACAEFQTHIGLMLIEKGFGDKSAFRRGIDQQDLLPNGTDEELVKDIIEKISILGEGG